MLNVIKPTASQSLKFLLDTHVFLWLMLGEKQLKERQTLEIAALSGGLSLCSISCWEIGMLVTRGRVNFGMSGQEWLNQALTAPGLHVLELSTQIAMEANYLPGQFHGDPIDRMLVAAARVKNLTLATHDKKIIAYGKQGYVSVLSC